MDFNSRLIIGFLMTGFFAFSQRKPKNEVQKDTVKKANTLDEVIITATRTPRQLSSLPMPVTLISKKQIQKSGSVRLTDILSEQTGIIFASDFGGFKGVQMQGMDSEYTKILINGVPLIGRSAGNLDLNRITVNNIKQIEIVKGPSSSLYGSEALGGVINIITEQPKNEGIKGNLHYLVGGGAKNELDLNTNILYKHKKIGFIGGLNLNSSNGYDLSPQTPEKTAIGYQNFTGNLQLTYDFSKNLDLSLSQRYFRQGQGETRENTQTESNSNIVLSHKINENWQVNYTFYATKYKTNSTFDGGILKYDQTLLRPEVRSQTKLGKSTLVFGLGANFESLKRTSFLKKEIFNSQYIFAQYDFNPIKNLNVVAGVRYDKNNKYQSAFSPKISSIYKINRWLSVKGSVGYGFKAPGFRQLYFNFHNRAVGYVVFGVQTLHELYGKLPSVKKNIKQLKPENSIGYNFGFQIKPIPNIKININGFRNDIKDMINVLTLQGGVPNFPRVYSYENRKKVYTQGISLNVNYRINEHFRFIGGYQFLEVKDREQEATIKKGIVYFRRKPLASVEKLQLSNYFGLANRSTHNANAKLFYQNKRYNFSANIRAIYRSKYALFDTNSNGGIIDDFDNFVSASTLVNTAIIKTFGMMTVQLGVNNLFNECGFENKPAFGYNDATLQLGRTYYTRIQFNF